MPFAWSSFDGTFNADPGNVPDQSARDVDEDAATGCRKSFQERPS